MNKFLIEKKVLIVKTLILPEIYHLISALFCPSDILKNDKLLLAYCYGHGQAR